MRRTLSVNAVPILLISFRSAERKVPDTFSDVTR